MDIEAEIEKVKQAMSKLEFAGKPRKFLLREYSQLEKELKRLETQLQQEKRSKLSLNNKSIESVKEIDEDLNTKELVPHIPAEFYTFLESMMERLTFVEDISILLNDTDIGLMVLKALQRLYPTLPVFGKRFLVIRQPSPEALSILGDSVKKTPSNYLANCADTKLLNYLLDLYQQDETIKFEDRVRLLDGMITVGSLEARELLLQQLQQGHLREPVWEVLTRLGPQGVLPIARLLDFANAIGDLTQAQFQQIGSLVFQTDKQDQLALSPEPFQTFLEKAQKSVGDALLHAPGNHLTFEAIEICVHVATKDAHFAEWFVYRELALLPEGHDELFLTYLREIATAWSGEGEPQILKNCSLAFQSLVKHDWGEDRLTEIPAKQSDEHFRNRLNRIITSQAVHRVTSGKKR